MNGWTRDRALSLMHEYTANEGLRRHMYAVELAMRAMAVRYGEDPDRWGIVGLLHDFDYERFPNPDRLASEQHPSEGVRFLVREELPADMCEAILGHAVFTGAPRNSIMAKALFAVDELSGFLVACTLVRPSRSLGDLQLKSVRKKLKDKAFARGVSRDEVRQGAEELGVPLDELIEFVRDALYLEEQVLGLGSP